MKYVAWRAGTHAAGAAAVRTFVANAKHALMKGWNMNLNTWLHGLVAASVLVLTASVHAENSQHDGPIGDWVFVPAEATEANGSHIAYGSCAFDIGLPGEFSARLGVHSYGSNLGLPDHAWADVSGGGWDAYAKQVQARYPLISVELICGTAPNADIETFFAGTAWIDRSTSPQFDCPAHKPVLMAARCQTQSWWN